MPMTSVRCLRSRCEERGRLGLSASKTSRVPLQMLCARERMDCHRTKAALPRRHRMESGRPHRLRGCVIEEATTRLTRSTSVSKKQTIVRLDRSSSRFEFHRSSNTPQRRGSRMASGPEDATWLGTRERQIEQFLMVGYHLRPSRS